MQGDQLKSQKLQMGFPYEDGINLKIDDQFITFEDARPCIINGRTMVPFRAVFEELGAEVTYDSKSGVISAVTEDGSTVTLTLLSRVLTVTYGDGTQKTVQMDAAPYLDQKLGRVFVPVRFVGEALGYRVYWDDYYDLAALVNAQAVISKIDENFTVVNKILKAKMLDLGDTFAAKGTLLFQGVLYGDEKPTTVSDSISFDAIIGRNDLAMNLFQKIDISELEDMLGEQVFGNYQIPDWLF